MKILVVGYGSIGKRHVNNILLMKKHPVVVLTKQKIDHLKNKNCIITDSVDFAMEQKPKAAIICTPTNQHIPIATKLSKSGIDLFIEKPLSNNFAGVKNLIKTAENKRLVTHVGCVLRFHPGIIMIKKMLKRKKIGKILDVEIENLSFLPDWHPNEDYTKSYAANSRLGGGVVLTCIHEMDYVYWLFGSPTKISADIKKISNLKIQAEDFAKIILFYKNLFTVQISLSYFQKAKSRKLKIVGTEGILELDIIKNTIRYFSNRKNKWVKIKVENADINNAYTSEIKYFLKCVAKRKQSMNNLKQNYQILKMALDAKKSSQMKLIG
ncbi:MAG: Gfo/Idh/MocA family oxidoreductase [Nitrosarchaeum sp.]|nr:Gfo/Idh/MocA family oxidoreductase [Nitrosarchaeum sp.]